MKRVILAEKPSVARDIARCLKLTTREDGYISGGGTYITWALGHLVELKEPSEYKPEWKRWSIESLPILPEKFELRAKEDDGAKKQLSIVKNLFKEADELICATDAGREGELIFRYIVTWSHCLSKPFKRLWINSMTDEAIQRGFEKIEDGSKYDNLYHAAKCRSESDWIVGLNSTRLYTLIYGQNRILWSIGRVQTPVLAMIVNRDLEIENFIPKDFWELTTKYRQATFKHTLGRFDNVGKAQALLDKVKEQPFTITEVKAKQEEVAPPQLFDLTELQKEMSKKYGFTADQTLSIAQSLYEKKHLTYPRTDSRYLTDDIKKEIPALLKKLQQTMPQKIEPLDLSKLSFSKRFFDTSKVNDHHAIIPTNVLPGRDLNTEEAKVYDAVATRLIASFYPNCQKEITTVWGETAKEEFKTSGTVIKKPGWQSLYGTEATLDEKEEEENQILPSFTVGETGPHEPLVKVGKTKPPKHLTESTLLSMMETAGKTCETEELKEALKNKGLGTPATRATIIETLISRKYIMRQKKNLLATDNGKHLISLIPDERIKSAELTGEWESKLKKMEKGDYSAKQFMQEIVDFTNELKATASKPNYNPDILGNCPLCNKEVIKGKEDYGCSAWREGCKFILRKDFMGLTLTKEIVQQLLQNRQTALIYSVNNGQETFDAQLILGSDGKMITKRVEAQHRPHADKQAIGECPLCKSPIFEFNKAYSCSKWREGCKMTIWKQISDKDITLAMAKKLLTKGETGVLKGFSDTQGKTYEANLKLVQGRVQIERKKT